jgi:hypothetical protein
MRPVSALFPLLLLLAGITQALASLAPLDARQIGLMLRSGYSSDAVLREVAARHFVAGALDPADEKQLIQAGAKESLLAALRNGTYAMSPAEIAAFDKARAAREERVLATSAVSGAAAPATTNSSSALASVTSQPRVAFFEVLKDKLLCYKQGSIVRYDDQSLADKKFYLLFFSANWSPVARKFTPVLVEYYGRLIAQHPEVEVIFFSADRSRFGMETYMSQSQMPWPAADYIKLATDGFMQKDLVQGVPALVLTDAYGKVLSNSYAGEKDLGPNKVLTDLDQLLAGGR